MEATGWNIRECSVRPGLYSRESVAQAERSVFAAPREPVAAVAQHSTNNAMEHSAAPTVVVKTECDIEHTSQGHYTGPSHHEEDSKTGDSVVVKQEYPEVPVVFIKTEYDAEDSVIQQERSTSFARRLKGSSTDVSVVVKQEHPDSPSVSVKTERDVEDSATPQGSHAGLVHPSKDYKIEEYPKVTEIVIKIEPEDQDEVNTQEEQKEFVCRMEDSKTDISIQDKRACSVDPRPSTSSGGSASATPIRKVNPRSAPRKNVKARCLKGSSDSSESQGRSTGSKEAAQIHSVQTPSKSDRKADTLNAHHEHDSLKHNTITKSALISRIHTGQKLYKRKQCENSAASKSQPSNLKAPTRNKTGGKPYECAQCAYSTSHISHLRRHMRTHTKERPYKCEHCEYSASELDSLKRHLRSHTGEKPYECDRCEYTTSHISHLKRHTRIHTGEKPYVCNQCEYSASEIGSLKRHVRTHTGEKPYKCDRCKYSAAELGSLKRHLRIHTSEKPYKCKHCEYCATQSGNLKIHMRTHNRKKTA